MAGLGFFWLPAAVDGDPATAIFGTVCIGAGFVGVMPGAFGADAEWLTVVEAVAVTGLALTIAGLSATGLTFAFVAV
jgi:hypothetical protein